MATLFDPPRIFELPVSKGGDLYFAFRYKPLVVDGDGEPILDGSGNRQYVVADYPAGSTVQVVIETDTTAITSDADIDGSLATIWEDTVVADAVERNKQWRAVITYDNGLDVVMCNGLTGRYDGKSQQ